MATYHLSATIHSRGKGHSAVHGAAYRARCALADERTGERWDYSRKARDVLFTGVYAPQGAPAWAQDRAQLWNHVEAFERRSDAQLCRSFEISLPHELTLEQNRRALQDWVRDNFTRKGLIADVAIHAPHEKGDQRNIHAHVAVVMRKLDGQEFAATKERAATIADRKAELEALRESWERTGNRHLERAGFAPSLDRRTLAEQGIDRAPTVHLGKYATALERAGIATELGSINRQVMQHNTERVTLRNLEQEAQQLSAQIIDLQAARAARGAAGQRHEPARVAEQTASHAEMQRTQRRGIDPQAMRAEITGLWQTTDSGKTFAAAVEERGYTLCPDDRRDFVIVDREGRVHNLARCIEDATARDVRDRMADIDRGSLLSIADARAALREAAGVQWVEAQLKTRPLNPIEQRVARAMQTGFVGRDFRDALGAQGIMLAKVTEKDLQAFAATRKDNELKATMRPDQILDRVPEAERGEIVAVTRRGNVYRLNPQRFDPAKLAQCIGRLPPSVAEAQEAWAISREHGVRRRHERMADRMERAQTINHGARSVTAAGPGAPRPADNMARGSVRSSARMLGKALNALEDLFSGLFSSPPPPPGPDEQRDKAIAADEAERLDAFRQHAAERARQSYAIDAHLNQERQQGERQEQEQAVRRYRAAQARDRDERDRER